MAHLFSEGTIRKNSRRIAREIEEILEISKASVQHTLSDNLGMHRIYARWVSRLLKK